MEDPSQWPLYPAPPHAQLAMRDGAQTVSLRIESGRNSVNLNAKIPNGRVAKATGGLHTDAGVISVLMRIADSYPPAIAAVQGYV